MNSEQEQELKPTIPLIHGSRKICKWSLRAQTFLARCVWLKMYKAHETKKQVRIGSDLENVIV